MALNEKVVKTSKVFDFINCILEGAHGDELIKLRYGVFMYTRVTQ